MSSSEPTKEAEHLIDLQYQGPDIDSEKFPVKAINRRLGQTLCEACDHGVDIGEMLFVPVGSDGYGYYHPECVLADQFLLDAFMATVKP
jgi:hypothetical protein